VKFSSNSRNIEIQNYEKGNKVNVSKTVVDKGFMLSEESVDMLDQFVEHYQKKPNFGQGGTIRNLVEKVIIEHLYDLPEDGFGMSVNDLRTIQYASLRKVMYSDKINYSEREVRYS
jgi:hypothetical protein